VHGIEETRKIVMKRRRAAPYISKLSRWNREVKPCPGMIYIQQKEQRRRREGEIEVESRDRKKQLTSSLMMYGYVVRCIIVAVRVPCRTYIL
jgi:hypothetical protein